MTTTVSTRLEPDELELLESLSEIIGFDRASLIRSLLRRGMRELRMEQAVDLFRKDKATLSRAAEIAGLSLWDFVAQMEQQNMELHYDVEEFTEDMKALSGKK